jgi:O-6-methylguanine DNA methyltransferase
MNRTDTTTAGAAGAGADGDDQAWRDALAGLTVPAPADLLDRVAARWSYVEGPVEDVFVAFTPDGIASVAPASSVHDDAEFTEAFRQHFGRPVLPAPGAPDGVEEALRTGDATGLRFDLRGRTAFERDVLHATLAIPPGELRPYAWVAWQIDRPRAVRAVGSALGHNPVPLLIPCHRVIRSDGTVGDYGFGSPMKRRLLGAEGVDLDRVEATVRRGWVVVGDDRSGLVCMPTCHRSEGVPPDHRHTFRTAGQAAAQGYALCPDCRPMGG